ncbi:hypothetical protein FRC17_009660 [Serendipita sp. 399]|nr:hypothetical protein FRC17_009660 [Serendipita sp. 399]
MRTEITTQVPFITLRGVLGATAAGTLAPQAVLAAMSGAGFTANGIAATSAAATWQSTLGNVAAGSIFSGLQSMGAVGVLSAPLTLGVGAAPILGYGAYKYGRRKRAETKLMTDLNNPAWKKTFWEKAGL